MPNSLTPDRLPRWLWWATVALGFAYWLGALARSGIAFPELHDLSKAVLIPWKGACTFGLALSVALAGRDRLSRKLAFALTISGVADMVLAAGYFVPSGVLFSISHVLALTAFWQHRAQDITLLRRIAAWSIPVTTFGLSVLALHGTRVPMFYALYPLLSGIMAATAVLSRLPVWLCGLGAAIFVCSDVLVLAWLGVWERDPSFGFLTWLTYFAGYALMARGVMRFAAAQGQMG